VDRPRVAKEEIMQDTITITGNVAADPELRRIGGGVSVVSFRVGSTSRRYDKSAGAWVDGETNWYSVSAFRGLGEHAYQSLRKGHPVIVSGRLTLRTWESGGTKNTSADIEAETIGHDLRWGTANFARPARSQAQTEAPESREGAGESWAVPAAAEWSTATPGEPAGASSDEPTGSDAGADADADADAELAPTPF
jgi:single-strand DNA-binding protein